MGNILENIEDKTFKMLIKRYTEKRDFQMVFRFFYDYGVILLDREEAENGQQQGA